MKCLHEEGCKTTEIVKLLKMDDCTVKLFLGISKQSCKI